MKIITRKAIITEMDGFLYVRKSSTKWYRIPNSSKLLFPKIFEKKLRKRKHK